MIVWQRIVERSTRAGFAQRSAVSPGAVNATQIRRDLADTLLLNYEIFSTAIGPRQANGRSEREAGVRRKHVPAGNNAAWFLLASVVSQTCVLDIVVRRNCYCARPGVADGGVLDDGGRKTYS